MYICDCSSCAFIDWCEINFLPKPVGNRGIRVKKKKKNYPSREAVQFFALLLLWNGHLALMKLLPPLDLSQKLHWLLMVSSWCIQGGRSSCKLKSIYVARSGVNSPTSCIFLLLLVGKPHYFTLSFGLQRPGLKSWDIGMRLCFVIRGWAWICLVNNCCQSFYTPPTARLILAPSCILSILRFEFRVLLGLSSLSQMVPKLRLCCKAPRPHPDLAHLPLEDKSKHLGRHGIKSSRGMYGPPAFLLPASSEGGGGAGRAFGGRVGLGRCSQVACGWVYQVPSW